MTRKELLTRKQRTLDKRGSFRVILHHKRGRWSTAGAVLFFLLFLFSLSACGILGLDVFPSYLGNTMAQINLDSYLPGVTKDGSPIFMVFLDGTYGGTEYRYLGLLWYSSVTNELLILLFEGDRLSYRGSLSNLPAGAYLGVAADGRILTGSPVASGSSNYAFVDPRTLQVENNNNFTSSASFYRAWVVVSGGTTSLVTSESSGSSSTLYWYNYSNNSFTENPKNLTAASFLLDLLRWEGTLWFLIGNGATNQAIPYGVSDFSSFNFESQSISLPSIPLDFSRKAFISPGGVIVLRHENGGIRLSRYALLDGSFQDDFSLPFVEDGLFAFAADGKRWAFYDVKRRRLYLLRSWW
ncbi:MAG: hypothetical protein N2Z76_01740 [Treponemataceae bacterium]|nr:hypothetical protein [Treponemataceae bacterium]